MEKQELISMIEENDCNLERIKNVIGLLWDLYVFKVESLNEYELREKYTISQTLIDTLFQLIIYKGKESKDNIEKIYKK